MSLRVLWTWQSQPHAKRLPRRFAPRNDIEERAQILSTIGITPKIEQVLL